MGKNPLKPIIPPFALRGRPDTGLVGWANEPAAYKLIPQPPSLGKRRGLSEFPLSFQERGPGGEFAAHNRRFIGSSRRPFGGVSKPALNYYRRKSSRSATKLPARSLACRSFPASTLILLRARRCAQRRGPGGGGQGQQGRRVLPATLREPSRRRHQVPSSVAISGYGGGSGWRPLAVALGCGRQPVLSPVEGGCLREHRLCRGGQSR